MKNPVKSISVILKEALILDAEFVFLMGSAETERFHADSDVDVAVFWKSSVTKEQIVALDRLLEEKLSRDVDLISLNDVDVIFARQVLESGRLLVDNSPGELLNWKMKVLADYPDFKTSRKIIEDNILNRKKYV